MPGELPGDWRERTVAMIRGAEPLRGDWFTGGPVCTPLEQLGIYAEQFRLRVEGGVRSEVPGLVHLMGDAATGWIRRYLAACPPTSWTLNRVADPLVAWLEAEGVPRAWVEMAILDRAVQRGFEAADAPPVTVDQLVAMPRLALQPHVTLLRFDHDVHELRSAVLSDRPTAPLVEGHFLVVVFRRSLRMRHWVVPGGMYALLEAIGDGRTVADAIDVAFRTGRVDLPTLQAEIGGWFREMAERSLVRVTAD